MIRKKHELWVDFGSKAPEHLLKTLREHCKSTGVKIQHFIAIAIEEKLERAQFSARKPKPNLRHIGGVVKDF